MKKIIISASILLLIYTTYRIYKYIHLDRDLKNKIRKGALILDVRTPWEFEQGHLPQAIDIPLSKLRTVDLPFDTGQMIITCCSHGLRSIKAVKVLHARGYKHVYNGGAWEELKETIQ